MAKELDTSWFDLKNYEALKSMSIEDWIWQLLARHNYAYMECNRQKIGNDQDALLSIADTLKKGVIPNSTDNPYGILLDMRASKTLEREPFATASINSLTSISLWEMANDDYLDDVWDACRHVSKPHLSNKKFDVDPLELAEMPYDFHIKRYSQFYNSKSSAHVVIDLYATDEQIKKDFAHWLANYRKAVDIQPQKKLFAQADFDHWVQYGIIPYLDLVLIAKIEGKKITQNRLARLIFPDEFNVDLPPASE